MAFNIKIHGLALHEYYLYINIFTHAFQNQENDDFYHTAIRLKYGPRNATDPIENLRLV